ncbi:hypothetical protein AAVH_25221, partial [Aphelenchoides avenae]
KHRAIEDDLLRQLSEKDTQIELLTEENSLLEKDFEQLRKDYQDLQRSHDEREKNETEKAAETAQQSVGAVRTEAAEKGTEMEDLDCSSSTPRSERSVPSTSSRVKDDPEKLLQWGRKYKMRAEQLREELEATKEKVAQWKNDNSYLKRVVEKHQTSIAQLGDKLRQEESAKTAALAQLQVKCLKINELEGSVTALQQQLEFEEHSVTASRQRFDEAKVEFLQQIAVKESIIAKLLLEKEAWRDQGNADVTLQASTVSSSRSRSSERSVHVDADAVRTCSISDLMEPSRNR